MNVRQIEDGLHQRGEVASYNDQYSGALTVSHIFQANRLTRNSLPFVQQEWLTLAALRLKPVLRLLIIRRILGLSAVRVLGAAAALCLLLDLELVVEDGLKRDICLAREFLTGELDQFRRGLNAQHGTLVGDLIDLLLSGAALRPVGCWLGRLWPLRLLVLVIAGAAHVGNASEEVHLYYN